VSKQRPHEPAELRLIVTRGEDGALILRTPVTPGWAFCCRRPADLAHGIEAAYAEVACAMYARWRGVLYDLAETEEEIPAAAYSAGTQHPAEPVLDEVERRRRRNHPNTHPPEAWVELEDGAMLSPSGKRYRPDSLVASRVKARRASG
jgi:hypothetical protein